MAQQLLWAATLVAATTPALAAAQNAPTDAPVVASMDELSVKPPAQKGRAQLVDGKSGKAVQLHFDKDAKSTFFTSRIRGTAQWDNAAGLSFWVKGDGPNTFGGLHLIHNEDYAVRYEAAFPVRGDDWRQVTLAWSDFVPVLPGDKSRPLDPAGPNKPSGVSAVWFGKWFYWGDYPAQTFAMDDLRLAASVPRDADDHKPAGPPLGRFLDKLKAGKAVNVVTTGDSLTDTRHWANRQVAWPGLLAERLRKEFGSDIKVHNPAVGGTTLRQSLVLHPVWLDAVPEPDLVTICFGYNDWDAGVRGGEFERTCAEAVDRVRRATGGKADVLVLATAPAADRWETMAELSAACRQAAAARNAGLADLERAFHAAGGDRGRLYVRDRVHLGPAGHELVAETVLAAVRTAGR